jgi:hypothetical protein
VVGRADMRSPETVLLDEVPWWGKGLTVPGGRGRQALHGPGRESAGLRGRIGGEFDDLGRNR